MTATADLLVNKIEGESSSNKTTTINEALDAFNRASGGRLALVLTGGTRTLSTIEAQNLFLDASGTLASNSTVEIPIADGTGRLRSFIIRNGTSGAFTLTLKLVGSTGLLIPQGSTVIVVHDGTDLVVVQTALPPWIAPSLTNSWVNFSGSPASDNAGYRRRNGRVELNGCIKDGSAMNTVAFTLPAGFRPANRKHFAVDSNNAFGKLMVDSDGTVTPYAGTTAHFSLDGISFDPA